MDFARKREQESRARRTTWQERKIERAVCVFLLVSKAEESEATRARVAQKRDGGSATSWRRPGCGGGGDSLLQVGRKVKKKMRCHPIVLLAGLLTVVRAQGQCLPGIPSVLFILTLRFPPPLWRQLCLTLRSPALAPIPVHSGVCISRVYSSAGPSCFRSPPPFRVGSSLYRFSSRVSSSVSPSRSSTLFGFPNGSRALFLFDEIRNGVGGPARETPGSALSSF